jgi:iron complex outermembrane receptor protein
MIQTINRKNMNTGEVENYGAELEAEWRVNDHWALSTNHSLLHMKYKVVAAPVYKGFVGIDYRCGKWLANAGVQYVNSLYTAVGDKQQKENFCLVNLAVTYALAKDISLWVRGENLLAQDYEINLGYPMPRATFMGGVSLRF